MTQRLILGLLVAVVAMLGFAMWRQERARPPSLQEIVGAVRSDKLNMTIENRWMDMQSITTQVTGQSGQVHTVTTARLPDETIPAWKARHQEAIEMAREM